MFPDNIRDFDNLNGARGPLPVDSVWDKLFRQNEELCRLNCQLVAQNTQISARLSALEQTVRDLVKPRFQTQFAHQELFVDTLVGT